MSTTFPRVRRSQRGYNIDEVEEFLESARVAYSVEPGSPNALDSDAIRHAAFRISRGGYATDNVDRALERLEDAFAARERETTKRQFDAGTWESEVRETAKHIIARLDRPHDHKFQRVSFLSNGYDRKQVDAFANRLLGYFRENKPLTIDEVRTVAFRPKKGGYREAQVDLVLDAVIGVMLAVK